jgi:intracellular multiplication protein IcmE
VVIFVVSSEVWKRRRQKRRLAAIHEDEELPPPTDKEKLQEAEIKAGDIQFAVIETSVNSDERGPVLATIIQGKLKGARLIGTFENATNNESLILRFNVMSIKGSPRTIRINTVAIDPNTARTALSSYTDNHYLLRYGSLFAASFIQGYGQAFQTSGQTVITNGLQTVTANPDYTPWGKFLIALGNVGTRFSSLLTDVFNTPPTVHVNSGTAMGILFLTDLPTLPT